jgi:hypothetical protein
MDGGRADTQEQAIGRTAGDPNRQSGTNANPCRLPFRALVIRYRQSHSFSF